MTMSTNAVTKGYFARITNGEVVSTFRFQYNPTRVVREHQTDYEFVSPPGSPLPSAYFRAIQGQVITFQLLFDASETFDDDKEGVSAQMAELESYNQPDISQFTSDLGSFVSPPQLRFGLGKRSWAVLSTSITFTEERFNRQMVPTRARADVSLRANFTDIAAVRSYLDRLDALRMTVAGDR